MGLNEGINVFFEEDGTPRGDAYVPAYIRRYPFLLAKLRPDVDEMSLCFDPTTDIIGDFKEGEALFADGQPSDHTKGVLDFCEKFEEAGARTQAFIKELDAEKLKGWHETGLLPLIYAHLMSLDLMRFIFAKQAEQGKGPTAANGAAAN